MKNNDI